MISQTFEAFQFDGKTLRFTATSNGDISADTFEWIAISASGGGLAIRKTSGSGITIDTPGSPTAKGVLLVSLVGALDIAAVKYAWQLRRTTTGRPDTLARGLLPLEASFRDAV